MTFDSLGELDKINECFPDAEVLLRIRVTGDEKTAQCPMSMKFGCSPACYKSLIERCFDLKLQLKGVSFHVGSGCSQAGMFTKALKEAEKVFAIATGLATGSQDQSPPEAFFSPDDMNILDIGGGFPGEGDLKLLDSPHSNHCFNNNGSEKCDSDIADTQVLFRKMAGEILTFVDSSKILCRKRMIAEPGRFFAHKTTALITKVIGVHDLGGFSLPNGQDEASEETAGTPLSVSQPHDATTSGERANNSLADDSPDDLPESENGGSLGQSEMQEEDAFICDPLKLEEFDESSPTSDNSLSPQNKWKPRFRYFLADGVYGSFNNLVYDHANVRPPEIVRGPTLSSGESSIINMDEGSPSQNLRHQVPQKYPALLFGPTCDGFDLVAQTDMEKLNEGDFLVWPALGAYTQAAASKFNGFGKMRKWYYHREN